jgi:ComF family protein
VIPVSIQNLFQTANHYLSDLLFPPRCINCDTPAGWLCSDCLKAIPLLAGEICFHCGTPKTSTAIFCRQCQQHPLQYLSGIRAAALFENNPLRNAIHFLKYRNHKAVAAVLAQILQAAYVRFTLTADVIVPVPLHSSRFKERGYNQCELLANELGKLLNMPVNTTTLYRARPTKTQMKLTAAERHQNMHNAFACRDQQLAGKTILLIDDVCTTGSTLDACAASLQQSGTVTQIWGLTLAKAR